MRLKKEEEVKQEKPLRMMTTSELKEVIAETKPVYNKYQHCYSGDTVFCENIPVQKPVYTRLLDTLEAEGYLIREKDFNERHRSYIPTLTGWFILSQLRKNKEAMGYLQERANFAQQKELEKLNKYYE